MVSLIYLILAFITLYVCGCYYNFHLDLLNRFRGQLLFLFVVEVILYLAMLFWVLFSKKNSHYRLIPQRSWVRRTEALPCGLQVRNTWFLPFRFKAVVSVRFRKRKDREKIRIFGVAPQHDASETAFQISCAHCGFMELEVTRFRVGDPLHIFQKRKRMKRHSACRVAVIPKEKVLHILPKSSNPYQHTGVEDTAFPAAGTDVAEIYQFREYQPGDSMKNIYWNLSARNDEFWIKEYSKSAGRQAGVFIDLLAYGPVTLERMDAFYEIVSALLIGLLQSHGGVIISWFDKERKRMMTKAFLRPEERAEILTALYHANICPAESVNEKYYYKEVAALAGEYALRVDLSLKLSYGTCVLKQFTEKNYEPEISEFKVVIPG